MKLSDAIRFLAFDKAAILSIAQTPLAPAVGFLLVFTASIARNYDGADLIHEWSAMSHGIAVSTINAFLLFCLVALPIGAPAFKPAGFWRPLVSFLAIFWMTSPMAWLYAIPWEQFLKPVDALAANAWTLAFVSVWRVLLITRVLQVLFNAKFSLVLFIVLAYSDALVLLGTMFAPVPVVDFMGGMRYTDEERFLSQLNFQIGFLSLVVILPLLIAAAVSMRWIKGGWAVPEAPPRAPTHGILGLVVASYLLSGVLLVLMQPQQQNRYRVEAMLRRGEIREALKDMNARPRSDFPKIWDPPPRRPNRGESMVLPEMQRVRDALKDHSLTGWARDVYLEKSWRLGRAHAYTGRFDSPTELARIADECAGEGKNDPLDLIGVDPKTADLLRFHLEHDTRFTDHDRELLADWIVACERLYDEVSDR